MTMKITAVESTVRVVERDAHRPAPDQYERQRQTRAIAVPQQTPPTGGVASSIVDALGSLEAVVCHNLMAKERLPISPLAAIAVYRAMASEKGRKE